MNWYFNASGPDLNWSVLLWCDWSSKCESWSDWLVVSQFPGSLTHLCCWAWKRETLGECTSATCQTLRQVKEHQLGFVPNNRNIKINRYCKRLSCYNLYWFFKSINSIQLRVTDQTHLQHFKAGYSTEAWLSPNCSQADTGRQTTHTRIGTRRTYWNIMHWLYMV